MKLRIALGLAGVLLLAVLIGAPGWTKATAQDTTYEIERVDTTTAARLATELQSAGADRAQALPNRGLGHWRNGPLQCKVQPWHAPNGLVPCKTIIIGGVSYHIAGVALNTIFVD